MEGLDSGAQKLVPGSLRCAVAGGYPVECLAFHPDGSRIVGGSANGIIRIWSCEDLAKVARERLGKGNVTSVAYRPDGKQIAIGFGWSVYLWDWDDVESSFAGACPDEGASRVNCVTYSSSGRWIAAGCDNATIRVWDTSSGRGPDVLRGHEGGVNSVAFSPDGRWIISGSEDSTVRVWEATDAPEALTLHGEESPIIGITFSPDGGRIAVIRDLKYFQVDPVQMFDAETGIELASWGARGDAVSGIAFTADGQRILGIGDGGRVHAWNARTYKRVEATRDFEDATTGAESTRSFVLRAVTHFDETVIEPHRQRPTGRILSGCARAHRDSSFRLDLGRRGRESPLHHRPGRTTRCVRRPSVHSNAPNSSTQFPDAAIPLRRGHRGASGAGRRFSTFKVESAAPNGLCAIGTIVAISCVVMFTYKKWQAAGCVSSRDAP